MKGRFYCQGYRVQMTAWRCIENQLSDFCLPGFPCHTCPVALTIRPRRKGSLHCSRDGIRLWGLYEKA